MMQTKLKYVGNERFRELLDLEPGETEDMIPVYRRVTAWDKKLTIQVPMGWVMVWDEKRGTLGVMKADTDVERLGEWEPKEDEV